MPIKKFYKAFTLVELLITIAIASIISVTIFTLYDRGTRDFIQVQETSEIQNEANLIFALIEKDLARGGFVHPIRGDISNVANCKSGISSENAVKIVSGEEVSACYDIPNFEQNVAYRYKITYKKGTFTGGPDENTLYKRVQRTDDCINTVASLDPNFTSLTHAWEPVARNISTIAFTHPTIGTTSKTDTLDVDINFNSRDDTDLFLNFRKRVFLRNKELTNNSTQCDDKCPNAKNIFAGYEISNNNTIWDPSANNVPSARIVISENYQSGEDRLEWSSSLATQLSLTVQWMADTGVLSIDGNATAQEYQDFLRTVRYVNTINVPTNRTTVSDADDRSVILAVGAPGICADLIPREVGDTRHFYCYVESVTGGSGGFLNGEKEDNTLQGNNYWWSEADFEARNTSYYNLIGYLGSVTSQDENDYILEKIRDPDGNLIAAWTGGSDAVVQVGDTYTDGTTINANFTEEGDWHWVGGPEDPRNWDPDEDAQGAYTPFRTDEGGNIAGQFNNWMSGEPNDCCRDLLDEAPPNYTDPGIAGQFFENRGGEHFLQYSESGGWNDLFNPGLNNHPSLQTDGYVLEFSSNWSSTNVCSNATPANVAACVNYFLQFGVVLDNFDYTDPDMLDICEPNP